MHDDHAHGDPLAMEALYAGGELEGPEQTAFERRLGEDQAARDALVQAVQLSQGLSGNKGARPDPSYRGRVRQRSGRGAWEYRGHPALWAVAGAAAAVLVMLGLPRPESGNPGLPPVANAVPPPARENPAPAVENDRVLNVANTWAELSNQEYLERVQTDETRRKLRHEERLRPPNSAIMKN